MAGVRTVVVLDRFDGHHDIHRRNRQWLAERIGYTVVTLPGEEPVLADLVCGAAPAKAWTGAGSEAQSGRVDHGLAERPDQGAELGALVLVQRLVGEDRQLVGAVLDGLAQRGPRPG